jgi:ubiquinone/menaquinone biosynthesis C-methylase UbiE
MPAKTGQLPLLGRLYLWATYRLYNELAWAYDLVAWIVSSGRWSRWRSLALDFVEQQPVLEVGFGTGELLLAMRRQGWQVSGIDLSPSMHRVTTRKMRQHGLWVPRVQGAAQNLPFADDSFGSIVITFPAAYIVDPLALAELRRVLQPGGRMIVAGLVVFVDHALFRRFSRLVFGTPPTSPLAQLEERSTLTGFKVTTVIREDPPVRVPILIAHK